RTPLWKVPWPPGPTGAMTRFGTVTPAAQLRLEASGRDTPVGKTVKKPAALVLVAVTFITTALTPAPGIPPAPVTWTSSVLPWPRCAPALVWPLPERVSVMRAGVTDTYSPAEPPAEGA